MGVTVWILKQTKIKKMGGSATSVHQKACQHRQMIMSVARAFLVGVIPCTLICWIVVNYNKPCLQSIYPYKIGC
jgi:hypothetical protein